MAAQEQVINYGATANDGTGDPLRDAFIKVDNNFANIWAAGPVGSNVTIVDNTIGVTNTNGNIILAPNGVGVIQTNNHIIPRINGVYSLGSPNVAFRSAYIGSGGLYVTGNLTIDGTIFGNIDFGTNIVANLQGSVLSSDGSTTLVNAISRTLSANSATLTGNVTADYYIGDGSLLSNITVAGGTAIVNGTSNVVVADSGNVTVGVAGVSAVATFTTTGLTIPGNVAAGNISGNGAALTSVSTDRGSDTNNWDTLTQMGAYKVNRVSWSGTTGTPIDSAVFVGLLQVITAGDTTTQMFFPGTVQSGNEQIQWNRTLWSGTWTNWTKIINNGQIIDAGSF
jgi:hypothetical protein